MLDRRCLQASIGASAHARESASMQLREAVKLDIKFIPITRGAARDWAS